MSFIISQDDGPKIDPVSAAMHHAVCYGIVDVGTQPQQGQYPSSRSVMFLWELPNERLKFEKDGVETEGPRYMRKVYTLSMGTKANLRKMLKSWRGRDFTPEELARFDLESVIGANCFLNVIHKSYSDGKHAGKTFANVDSVNPLAKGMPKLNPETPTISFFMKNFIEAGETIVFPESMPEWIQDMVKQSEEYIEHVSPKKEEDNPTSEAFPAANDVNPDLESSVPF